MCWNSSGNTFEREGAEYVNWKGKPWGAGQLLQSRASHTMPGQWCLKRSNIILDRLIAEVSTTVLFWVEGNIFRKLQTFPESLTEPWPQRSVVALADTSRPFTMKKTKTEVENVTLQCFFLPIINFHSSVDFTLTYFYVPKLTFKSSRTLSV